MVVNRHESPIKVKLIDFGLACPASAVMPGDRVGTVGYSAPEVMLGLPYNEAADMWSLGLVAVELGYESLETRYIKLTRLDDLEQVLRHPFFNRKSSPCTNMSVERPQNPVVFQHPSNLESKRSQKINCSFQNSVEFSLCVNFKYLLSLSRHHILSKALRRFRRRLLPTSTIASWGKGSLEPVRTPDSWHIVFKPTAVFRYSG
uniref:Protein kinase domain-containing protein n=1 Tax=Maylandia zebra TaxID=106582 RepID=A0A3P9CZ44_9CICH